MLPIAEEIWNLKYRLRRPDGEPVDHSLDATFARVAAAAASVEPGEKADREMWAGRFYDAMSDFGFVPGGRILAGAGSDRNVTLFNCFVMDEVPDDLSGIFDSVRSSALTMQMGGGIGLDFSTLRPRGALVQGIGADASGPVSFMGVWDAMCRTIMSAGARRGAMMATLRADHPDIEEFIDAKRTPGQLTNFNLSVLVPDRLIEAVRADGPWELVFGGTVYRTVQARDLWNRIMQATYDVAEPGVIFIDSVNAANNLSYCETIHATNPCGEQPLPPSGACLLGALNLCAFVQDPFTPQAHLDLAALGKRASVAVRFLDNIIDVSGYPLPRQKEEALSKRRMGLGLTGLADALIMCGVRYGSNEAADLAGNWMRTIQENAYLASAALAGERGAFPLFDRDRMLASPMFEKLKPEVREAVASAGLRNGCLTTIAPTGTTSLLAGNVSSGIEPVFDFVYERRVLQADGSLRTEQVEDFAHALFQQKTADGKYEPVSPSADELPEQFVKASDLSPRQHLVMQAAVQRYVDSSISKTVNCPEDLPFEDFKDLYREAHELGLKGCTTFRPSPVRGAVLVSGAAAADGDGKAGQSADPEFDFEFNGEGLSVEPPKEAAGSVAGPAGSLEAGGESGLAPIEVGSATADVVYLSKPLERAPVLHGATYKLKWPGSDHALYVTINDIEKDGRRRPFEIFINTKSLEHYAWTVALTRMISAVFRRGGDVTFVAEELQAIFDPQGGRWVSGRYVASLQAAIGEIIEGHMAKIGFAADDSHGAGETAAADPLVAASPSSLPMSATALSAATASSAGRSSKGVTANAAGSADRMPRRQCPRCGTGGYVRREGCWTCEKCGFSQCD